MIETRRDAGDPGHSLERPSRRGRPALLAAGAGLLGLSLGGCNAAFWGNLVVLGVTVGIFFGTLALGRTTATSSAEASSSTRSRPR